MLYHTYCKCFMLVIKDKEEEINELRQFGLRKKSTSITSFSGNTGLIETRMFQKENFGMFTSGTALSFWNIPMTEVVRELERTFAENIVILDEAAAQIKVLAFFTDGKRCEDILSTLEATYPEMAMEKRSGNYYIFSK